MSLAASAAAKRARPSSIATDVDDDEDGGFASPCTPSAEFDSSFNTDSSLLSTGALRASAAVGIGAVESCADEDEAEAAAVAVGVWLGERIG